LYLAELELHDFRTYPHLRVTFQASGAFLYGPNGCGKSNLLEAIHVLCVGRSQRATARAEMIAHGARAASLRGVFVDSSGDTRLEVGYGIDRDGRLRLSLQGEPVATQREWFGGRPVASFGPEDLALVAGAPAQRRRFLDMLASQIDARYLAALIAYNRALTNRNRLLASRTADSALLDVYEEHMAEQGAILYKERTGLVSLCQEFFAENYRVVCGGAEPAALAYRAGCGAAERGTEPWQMVFSKTLKNNRKRDLELGYSTRGPHRDDVLLSLDKYPARTLASQGQMRSLALALRLSALQCLETRGATRAMLLVDDAFSELDDSRTARVFPLLRSGGQVFLASPTDRIALDPPLPRYHVSRGKVEAQ
jgi:DNA replication and repair protein RecF